MEKIEKTHVPRVYLKRETIEKMHYLAEIHGVNRSELYQEACDLLIKIYELKSDTNKFKELINYLLN